MSYALIRQLRRTAFISVQIRAESTMTNLTQEDFVFRPPLDQWSKVIREAEKVVGYPTSFMNLRWLLSDEFANLAMHLRKVVGSNHPIVKTAKTVLYNEHNNLQPWGLIILLLSKATATHTTSIETNTINEQQRILAELTEMIRTGHYIHRGLLNIPIEERDKNIDTELFANKIAILIGDYLLVTSNGMLARLKNQDLSYLISTALRDMSEGEFFGERDRQNTPLPGKPKLKNTDESVITNNTSPLDARNTLGPSLREFDRDKTNLKNFDEFVVTSDTLPLDVRDTLGSPVREWTLRTMYNGGSLFGRGCQGALLLAGKSIEEQELGYLFGSHLCLAWQAASEVQKLTSDNKTFSLVSAPVLFAINYNPELYTTIEKAKDNISDIDLEELRIDVLKTDAVEKTRMLYIENAMKAQTYVEMFGDSEPVQHIKRLIKTL